MAKNQQNTELVEAPAMEPVTGEELLALQSAQGDVIAELQAKISQLENEKAAAAKSGGGVVVTIEGAQYRVVHGLLFGGAKKSPSDIAADETLCQELLASGSSAIKSI